MLENLLHSDHSALWKSLAAIIPDHAESSGLVQHVSAKFSSTTFLLTLLSACATQQDKTSGWDVLAVILPNDLILRDMGYFLVEGFAAIEAKGAYWLSRLPLKVGATAMDGKSFGTLLRKSRGERLDIRVKLTATGHNARLVVIRASVEETGKRRREINREAKAKGRMADGRSLLLEGWQILVTNITAEKANEERFHHKRRWGKAG